MDSTVVQLSILSTASKARHGQLRVLYKVCRHTNPDQAHTTWHLCLTGPPNVQRTSSENVFENTGNILWLTTRSFRHSALTTVESGTFEGTPALEFL